MPCMRLLDVNNETRFERYEYISQALMAILKFVLHFYKFERNVETTYLKTVYTTQTVTNERSGMTPGCCSYD